MEGVARADPQKRGMTARPLVVRDPSVSGAKRHDGGKGETRASAEDQADDYQKAAFP